mmetsp:Transcript_41198/g.80539  ORF Transcript_41198/g.80539 Transcript_41198/m.80539 type:complete len:202 (-) Transcript_41198:75-680(-)
MHLVEGVAVAYGVCQRHDDPKPLGGVLRVGNQRDLEHVGVLGEALIPIAHHHPPRLTRLHELGVRSVARHGGQGGVVDAVLDKEGGGAARVPPQIDALLALGARELPSQPRVGAHDVGDALLEVCCGCGWIALYKSDCCDGRLVHHDHRALDRVELGLVGPAVVHHCVCPLLRRRPRHPPRCSYCTHCCDPHHLQCGHACG